MVGISWTLQLTFSGNYTLSIDLTKSWTNSTVEFNVVNKTAQDAPAWNEGYLWPDADKTSFYQWGGRKSSRYSSCHDTF